MVAADCRQRNAKAVGLLHKMVKQPDCLYGRNLPVKNVPCQKNQIGVFLLHEGQKHPVDKVRLIF